MTQDDIETLWAAAIDAESHHGIPWWLGKDMAPIAVRRWRTFARRNQSKHPTTEERQSDLAKGLQAHFEPDVPYTPRSEWLHLAQLLLRIAETNYRP